MALGRIANSSPERRALIQPPRSEESSRRAAVMWLVLERHSSLDVCPIQGAIARFQNDSFWASLKKVPQAHRFRTSTYHGAFRRLSSRSSSKCGCDHMYSWWCLGVGGRNRVCAILLRSHTHVTYPACQQLLLSRRRARKPAPRWQPLGRQSTPRRLVAAKGRSPSCMLCRGGSTAEEVPTDGIVGTGAVLEGLQQRRRIVGARFGD